MKRHASLVPLSREHQYALLLCLRIHRGVGTHNSAVDWLRLQSRKAVRFFDLDLTPHFQAEETLLFPAMASFTRAPLIIAALLNQHQDLRNTIDALRELVDSSEAAPFVDALLHLANSLEVHIRKEESQAFPLYQEEVTPEADERIRDQLLELIGPALAPRHPELLE